MLTCDISLKIHEYRERINYNLNMKRSSSSMKYAKNEITSCVFSHAASKYFTEMWKISNLRKPNIVSGSSSAVTALELLIQPRPRQRGEKKIMLTISIKI